MKKIFLLSFLLIALTAEAQKNYAYLNWDINKPLSSWIGSTSSRGGKAGYRVFLNSNNRISIGGEVNWATYDEYAPEESFQNGTSTTTTDYFKSVSSYGITVNCQYYFPLGNGELFFPYVGLGLGGTHNTYTLYYNIYAPEDNGGGFLARPEAGILVRLGTRKSVGLMAAVHYDYSTAKSESFDNNNFTSFGFQIGAMFMNRY